MLQQIEHGALAVAAQYRSIGQLNQGIVDSRLHQYHHLGDASTQTDNLIYDPSLRPYQVEGNRSGTPDDRWVFTTHQPFLQLLRHRVARRREPRTARASTTRWPTSASRWRRRPTSKNGSGPARRRRPGAPGGGARFGAGAELSAVFQLMRTTKEQQYIDRFNELIWPTLDAPGGRTLLTAVRALPYLGPGAADKLRPYVVKYRAEVDAAHESQPVRRADRDRRLGGQRRRRQLGDDELPSSHKVYPDVFDKELVYPRVYISSSARTRPRTRRSWRRSARSRRHLAYGNNRADFTFIPGVIVPGVLILKPDFPENMDDWPYLWGENEGTVGGASQYIFLAMAANELVKK